MEGTLDAGQFTSPAQQTAQHHSLKNVLKAIADIITFRWVVHLVERQLKKRLLAMGLKLDYGAIRLHIFRAGLSFRDLKVTAAKRESIFSVRIAEVAIHVRLWDMLVRKFLSITQVKVHNGRISVHEMDQLKALFPKKAESPKKSLSEPAPVKKGWRIGNVDIKNIGIFVDGEEGGHAHIESFSGSWQAKYYDLGMRFGVVDAPLKFSIKDIHMATLFKWHGFTTDSVSYDMEAKEIRIANVRIFPKVEPDYMDEHEPHITLHADLTIPEINFTGLDWGHTDMLHWRAERIDIVKPTFWAYQNIEKPKKPGHRPMPTQWSNPLPFKFMVDAVKITDGAVTYTFTPPSDKQVGRMSISNMDVLWEGYGNDITRPQAFTASTTMRWMEDCWLKASVTFPYEDKTSSFNLEGDLGAADFVQFNPVTIVAGGLHFVSGHWDTFKFKFDGNETQFDGKIWIEFDDVKVGFEDQDHSLIDSLKALAANTFVMRHSTRGEVREVEVTDKRDSQETVFAMWLHGLMTCFRKALLKV